MAGVPYNSTPGLAALLEAGPWEAANLLPIETNRATGQRRLGVPKGIWEALVLAGAPQKAVTGGYQLMVDPVTGENYYQGMAEDATGLSGLLLGGGSAVPKPSGSLGIFGGVMAKTADKAALSQAEKMAASGASRDDIWNATGWFKGKDGKWRFEIDDRTSFFKGAGTPKELAQRWGGDAGNVYRHPQLWEAYPELSKTQFRGKNELQSIGRFQPPDIGDATGKITLRNDIGDQARSVFLHEMQHATQGAEGFGRGASVGEYARGPMFSKEANDLKADLSRSIFGGISAPPAEVIASLKYGDPVELATIAKKHGFSSVEEAAKFLAQHDEMRTPFSQYHRTAGEVEARNVQARKDLTPEQRRAKAPWLTQDVPDEQQIVRFK